jgi:tetratricopeptide (TPR) repeat protein
MEVAQHYTEYIKQAKEAENEGDIETAIKLYEKAIRQKPLIEQPYNRLMILYRKEKEYNKELKVIDKALEIFTHYYDEKKASFKSSDKIVRLSKAILKSVSAGKKSGENNYPEPVSRWLIRKKTVEKKIK